MPRIYRFIKDNIYGTLSEIEGSRKRAQDDPRARNLKSILDCIVDHPKYDKALDKYTLDPGRCVACDNFKWCLPELNKIDAIRRIK